VVEHPFIFLAAPNNIIFGFAQGIVIIKFIAHDYLLTAYFVPMLNRIENVKG
jgi:hypothetical protein